MSLSTDQIERYLKPGIRGESQDCYAVTEANAGSDPSRIETVARPSEGGWVIDGEKWFATSGDVAKVLIVVANALVDGQALPTLFAVDADLPGIEFVDDPPFTHNYPHGHPTIRFTGVEIPRDAYKEQKEAFDAALAWVDGQPTLVGKLKEAPETLEDGIFTLEEKKGFFSRLLSGRPKSEALSEMPVRRTERTEEESDAAGGRARARGRR